MRRNRYFLLRHGESVANLSDLIISLPENGLDNYGLSDLGREQVAENVASSGLGRDTLVVASDFLRTRQTAEIAAHTLGASSPMFDAGLRERAFGQLEGRSGYDYVKVWHEDEKDPEHTTFGVESAAALAARTGAVLERLEREHDKRDILLVSHGDPLRFLQLHAAGWALTRHLQVRLFTPAEIRPLEELSEP